MSEYVNRYNYKKQFGLKSMDLVTEALKQSDKAKNCDNQLLIVCAKMGNFSDIGAMILDGVKTETLRRNKSHIQNTLNLLVPTDEEVVKFRNEFKGKKYNSNLSRKKNGDK